MGMPGRQYNTGGYRFGHNGQEKDGEIAPDMHSAEFWEYDARLGRRWEVDPVDAVSWSPYACFADNPIGLNDPDGLAPGWWHKLFGSRYGYGHKKFQFPSLKTITRTIGAFVRSVGRLFKDYRYDIDGIPMGNHNERNFGIEVIHFAPDDKKHSHGFTHAKDYDQGSIIRHKQKGSGDTDKGTTFWDAGSDIQQGEKIISFRGASLSYDHWDDPDYFSLINRDNWNHRPAVSLKGVNRGILFIGSSKMGYRVKVVSLKGLTDLPNSSNWDYQFRVRMKVWTPYTDNINGKSYKIKGVDVPNTNPRPSWHTWWYGR